jgi:hypothetical protein
MNRQFVVAVYRGSIHAVAGATGRDSSATAAAAMDRGRIGARLHHGVVELGAAEGVEFAPVAGTSGDYANVAPVVVPVGEHGGTVQVIGGWAAFARLHEADAPIYAAPFAESVRVEAAPHAQPVYEFPAGALVIPAAAVVEPKGAA